MSSSPLPWVAQSDFITFFQKECKWNRSGWLEKSNRRSESWSSCLCEGSCKWPWLLLERLLREDMIREHKILLQLRTDRYNWGKRSWSHCCLFPKSLTYCVTAARKANKALGIIRESLGNAAFWKGCGGVREGTEERNSSDQRDTRVAS